MSKVLKRKIREIGGSLNTTIPREIVYILKLEKGDILEFYKDDGQVCIRKSKK